MNLVPLSNTNQDFKVCPCGTLSVDPYPTRENGCEYCPNCGKYMTDKSLTLDERIDLAVSDAKADAYNEGMTHPKLVEGLKSAWELIQKLGDNEDFYESPDFHTIRGKVAEAVVMVDDKIRSAHSFCRSCGKIILRVEQPGGSIAHLPTCVCQVASYELPKRK